MRLSVRWRNGFVEQDNALPVREQDFSASMSRRSKISQVMSSGRLGNPLFYIIIGMGGAGLGGSGLDDGVILGLGWSHSRSQRSTLDIFPVGVVSPK